MKTKRQNGINWVLAGAMGIAGVTLTSGCDSGSELQAIVAGVQVAADTFLAIDGNNSRRNGDINFGDWLLDEIRF
jgi:hypothetical protein